MTQEEKQSQCLYGRTYKERLRSCGYCSATCPVRIPDFDTEVYNWLREHGSDETRQLIEMTARHFWEMGQNGGAMLHIADKSYKMERRDAKFEMMKDAAEYEVYDFSSSLESHPHITIPLDNKKYSCGDKVKVIIVMEDE